jgi:4-diphosphocytidyl-2-C-methyl-D-erythritol kinase
MFVSGTCDIKINLTLRVLGKRGDGYHDICSLFWRLESPEALEANFFAEKDRLIVTGADIPGENILTRTCRHIRNVYGDDFLPPVEIRLHKHLPGGSGVGAGSGNAAEFLRLVRDTRGFDGGDMPPGVASLGADVAFLASGHSLAVACGVGDILHGIEGNLRMSAVVFFPCWSANTAHAYHMLDAAREAGRCGAISEAEARDEALSLLESLWCGRVVGEIPNDFIACAGHEDKYTEIEGMAAAAGAAAWGLCGSGSSYCALFRPEAAVDGKKQIFRTILEKKDKFQWLRQILVLE